MRKKGIHYRVVWNYGGIWQDCELRTFNSLERAIRAALRCEKEGGAPHRIWAISRVIDPREPK